MDTFQAALKTQFAHPNTLLWHHHLLMDGLLTIFKSFTAMATIGLL